MLGTRLPGPGAVYISQTLNFRAPVKIGDTVDVIVTVAELIPERQRARLACTCKVGDEIVLDGEALGEGAVVFGERPAAAQNLTSVPWASGLPGQEARRSRAPSRSPSRSASARPMENSRVGAENALVFQRIM